MDKKLGLISIRTVDGFASVFSVNDESTMADSIRDFRLDGKALEGLLPGSGESVIVYTAVEDGEFYTVLCGTKENEEDLVAASVCVPADLEISGQALADMIEATRQSLLSDFFDRGHIATLYSQDYPICEPRTIVPTAGDEYAVKYYGEGTGYVLKDLVDGGMSQMARSSFKAIFLIDSASSVKAEACLNLSETKSSPKAESVVSDQLAEPVEVPADPSEDNQKKLIRYSDIMVKNEDGIQINSGYSLLVDGKPLEERGGVYVSVQKLNEVIIQVTCAGFRNFKGKADFTKGERLSIKLKRQVYVYNFVLPLTNGLGQAEISVESTTLLNHTPIKGYQQRLNDRPVPNTLNRLEFRPKTRILGVLLPIVTLIVGLLLGFVLMYLALNSDKDPAVDVPEVKADSVVVVKKEKDKKKEQKDTVVVVPAAPKFACLDNPVWVRSELEANEQLKGLWDEVNTYKFDKILTRKASLGTEGNLGLLFAAIEDFKARGGVKSGAYNLPDDEQITIAKYISKLNPAPAQQ